jgi:hypothetical protein
MISSFLPCAAGIHSSLMVLLVSCALPSSALAMKDGQDLSMVTPPTCENYKGEIVRFVDIESQEGKVAAGMARRDAAGEPIVIRSNYSAAPEAYQRFIDLHECAHHQTGDVDRPHPPRNSPEHLMNESISDCIAILRLRDDAKVDQRGFDRIAAAMRLEMEKIGFPEISISSRISNITNCYADYGPSNEFIAEILDRRGLLQGSGSQ